MERYKVLLDSDVIINWLTKEEEGNTGRRFWEIPYKIIKAINNDLIEGSILLFSLLEIRYVLRRKKIYPERLIGALLINDLFGNLQILIPDEICLLRANELQSKHPLDPFDSLLLSFAMSLEDTIFITRDKDFKK